MPKLDIKQDEYSDNVTIEGIKYSNIVFMEFGKWMPEAQLFKFIYRDNGVLTIEKIDE